MRRCLTPVFLAAAMSFPIAVQAQEIPNCPPGAWFCEETDVQALAGYLGSLPAPRDAAPDARNTQRMPIACGSKR